VKYDLPSLINEIKGINWKGGKKWRKGIAEKNHTW
jgi:hypothetical protein